MRWLVSARMTISVCTEVEAPSAAAAIRIARERPAQELCGDAGDDEWCASELDGELRSLIARRLPEVAP